MFRNLSSSIDVPQKGPSLQPLKMLKVHAKYCKDSEYSILLQQRVSIWKIRNNLWRDQRNLRAVELKHIALRQVHFSFRSSHHSPCGNNDHLSELLVQCTHNIIEPCRCTLPQRLYPQYHCYVFHRQPKTSKFEFDSATNESFDGNVQIIFV